MNWESVRLQHLAYLDAVSRLGHFGDAAAELGVTQPALSQGLARLESIAGVELFETRGRRRALSPAGRMLSDYAAVVLTQTRKVSARIEARSSGRAGLVSVGMIDAAALYLLSDALAAYRRANPEVELHLAIDTSSRLLERLAAGGLDLAIVVAPAVGYVTSPIVDEDLHVYAAAARATADIDRWVLYPSTSHTRAAIDAAFVGRGLLPQVEAESGNPSVLAQLARLGVGATVLPAGIADAGEHPLVLIETAVATRTLVSAQRAEAKPDALVNNFLKALGISLIS